ncbi:AAA family ATPase [Curtobacterium flaccumfaciens]|uniref:AAA family ATPase n=1 Tax=Curtobacterium flaccumfaciens TaxID=2035 RepID=UPI001BDF25A7|nr:AAA family ATPase [Curtobacterium flaccumfaciens]MBT1684628.1 AAA family ATPase [Curtobacterium flaccumfaciens pv. flaccumfaciens]
MSRSDNRTNRLRAALRYLDEQGGAANRLDVWNAARTRVPLEGEELEPNQKGKPQGQSDFFWGSAGLVHAGFLTKPVRGEWHVTDDGRRTSADAVPFEQFREELNERQRAFQRALREDREVRLRTEILPPDNRADLVRTTSQVFVERGLRALDSVFAPGRQVWRTDVVDELERCFLEQPDVDGADFLDKLGRQFDDTSDDAKLLMAELIGWQVLPLQNPGERKKRQRVEFLLQRMDHRVTIPAEIDDAFRAWSFNPGTAMSVQLYRALSIVVHCAARWIALSPESREHALDDPWAWRDLVDSLPGASFPTQRNELLYLVHPGVFGEVISGTARDAIRQAFAGEVEPQADDDPDALFQQIAIALQGKAKGPAKFYEEPLLGRWQPVEPETVQADGRQREELDDPASVPLSEPMIRTQFPSVRATLAHSLHMPEDWLQDTLDLVERRKQVILYGPPGTGKTFLAQALSKHVTDGTDGETTIVQFHPTYSYEDFFEGFRPVANDDSGNLAFTLRKGPLRRLADAAAANPEANYFLVIDEINRGNIAKVFGELYFLLEYRDSEISLLYSDEPFTLPSNIFVIGTMNTADRSIAMLDAAMRRRFAFIELHPERVPVQNVLTHWVATKGLQDDRADLLTRLNTQIEDHDAKVGPSFLMRDLEGTGLQDVWRYEILPLLAEHHYGEGVDLEARYGLATLRRQATRDAADGAEGVSFDD